MTATELREAIVHVVFGSTGEYSDRQEWMIAAYPTQEMAQEHVRLAEDRSREIFAASDRHRYPRGQNAYDPDGSMDYTGNIYYTQPVPLSTTPPQPTPGDEQPEGAKAGESP